MPIKILMPALSPTMEKGNLAKWLKKEGDKIEPGEVIAEIETDKATMEVEAVDEGIIAKIIVASGTEDVEVNSLIAVLVDTDENLTKEEIESFIGSSVSSKTSTIIESKDQNLNNKQVIIEDLKPVPEHNNINDQISIEKNTMSFKRVFASPLARRLAKIDNVDLATIKGTGDNGRIIKRDITNRTVSVVDVTMAKIGRNGSYKIVPNDNIRKIIAKRLTESKATIPHFYLSIECNVDKLFSLRQNLNDDYTAKLSVNDFIVLATAKALKAEPKANSSWQTENIIYYNDIDISVAVATDNGLITPIVKNADQQDIFAISNEIKTLVNKAKANTLRPEEFQGGGFTISNLGMYSIKNFKAIINPPQSCILAVGASIKKPVVISDQITIANMMEVTLSCDHRAVDGAVAANFLKHFKNFIEQPMKILFNTPMELK